MTESNPPLFAKVIGLVVMAVVGAIILESVVGYRERCLAAGFNETAAEQMALQMHARLLGFST